MNNSDSIPLEVCRDNQDSSLFLRVWRYVCLWLRKIWNKNSFHNNPWSLLTNELDSEKTKLLSFDETLIFKLANVSGKSILDYGSGAGIIAQKLKSLGADVKAYDISPEMLALTSEKIGTENVYSSLESIPQNSFDIINCSLVLCIVSENEVFNICNNIKNALNEEGSAYFGFCNPQIFQIKESQLDFRIPTGDSYSDIHTYKKIKKEGNYKLFERHRPIEWYEGVFQMCGLKISESFYTPEYSLRGERIKDFIIIKAGREKYNAK